MHAGASTTRVNRESHRPRSDLQTYDEVLDGVIKMVSDYLEVCTYVSPRWLFVMYCVCLCLWIKKVIAV